MLATRSEIWIRTRIKVWQRGSIWCVQELETGERREQLFKKMYVCNDKLKAVKAKVW